MKNVNVLIELRSFNDSFNEALIVQNQTCMLIPKADSITTLIINYVTVIAPAKFTAIKLFLINKANHFKLKCNVSIGAKNINTCADLCSMQMNQTSLKLAKFNDHTEPFTPIDTGLFILLPM